MVQDAETIEKETKNENDDFIKTVIKCNEIYTAVLEQNKNKSTLINYLMTYLAGDNVSIFDNGLKTEDIFIDDDYLFDSSNEQETKLKIFVIMYIMILTRPISCLKIFQNQNL